MPRPLKPAERILNWGSSNLEDVSFLRLPEVKAITGLSKSSLYVLIREKSFPAPVRLGSRTVAWVKSEVKQWAADRVPISRFGMWGYDNNAYPYFIRLSSVMMEAPKRASLF
jgi:prophage regulatory protein